ncbi:MAG TPA: ComEC/Rec2 family competence protein [Clostridiaceae bacterium]
MKTIKIMFFVLLSIVFLNSCKESPTLTTIDYENKVGNLIVHYINVGQGDSELISFNNKYMLIDAGPKDEDSTLIKYLKKLKVKRLDYVIETHPHEDHIGEMAKVIADFSIGSFYAPKVTTTTNAFLDMVSALRNKNLKINVARSGASLNLDPDITCNILAPNSDKYANLNDYSIVLKLIYKSTSFIFMGDAQKLSEDEILSKNFDVKADVLKVGHHGSKTASSKAFLDKCMPSIAVISCGIGNDYNHPHKETLVALKDIGATIYRTDINKTVVLVSDGKNINRK